MKNISRTTVRAFIYFSLVSGFCLGMAFSIYSGELKRGLALGLLGGVVFALIMALYIFVGLTLFQNKLFFYSNIPNQFQAHNIGKIYFESVAGNVTGGRVKYGGLFLADDSILFIPHRFAIRPCHITLPLKEIKEIRKTNINLLKLFSGGLRNRLLINTLNGERYEFSVWDIDLWLELIKKRFNNHRTL